MLKSNSFPSTPGEKERSKMQNQASTQVQNATETLELPLPLSLAREVPQNLVFEEGVRSRDTITWTSKTEYTSDDD
ncbi:MAG: hypothetical protein A3F53_00430 [Candidatus Zambryskibacteria bacterium RIFCSPHIGHO2_12_FULL_48_10]|uniref:Uncharacterized protein n=1 Tax=Candidatus Zambryskibacteria bacterium RIFCSPHIGHO2_01_FULL_46_25 TaxID=1802738 RepID=A0A1G2T0G2_9BACT|nr:MAG: hypothetical protein UX71_C0002G0183 [Parcubacteria group bacterium GW2011_GWA1_47_10]OHA90101.1 MAG: hypothetical protein A2838_00515 [Candidatus Zambryskibacteria bacterium RIFCSPHIGHO2_01_FULL_46_25]OHB02012.1 MAG: hypothetical protein A3F53_00430 [Candidatus Zambryskibacteria bacterium RIFCSPHIGHO2_12_FULL_48_10]OHB06524.1 MAG: hypothetical protein A3A31_02740 [Candidatus Zambryskibacteria bacterium RIFCSPLOWO2_01_FULL_48_25]